MKLWLLREVAHAVLDDFPQIGDIAETIHPSNTLSLGNKKGSSKKSRGRKRSKRVSKRKAKEILSHGSVHGRKLTAKQRRYFGWIANN